MSNLLTYNVLSIDAWGNKDDGYEWHQWFNAGTIEIALNAGEQDILEAMIESGFITQTEGGEVEVEDDGYDKVIKDRETREPLFAIEYGNTI